MARGGISVGQTQIENQRYFDILGVFLQFFVIVRPKKSIFLADFPSSGPETNLSWPTLEFHGNFIKSRVANFKPGSKKNTRSRNNSVFDYHLSPNSSSTGSAKTDGAQQWDNQHISSALFSDHFYSEF
jgi:hypothetical protein